LRLLLTPRDNGSYYAVSELLVLTFTKAATAELKTRLRNRLLEMQRSLAEAEDAPESDRDPFLENLREQLLALGMSTADIAQQVALANFDEAAIFTIDSFCQKALKMVAFESGLPFKLELVMDMRSRYLRFAYDFWHSEIAQDPMLAPFILSSKSTPESWLDAIKGYIGKPYVQFNLPKDEAVADLLAAKQAAWANLVAMPDTTLRELFGVINDAFALETFTKVSFKADKLSTYADQVLASLALPQMPTTLSADTLKSLEVMSTSKLKAWTRKGKIPPEHVFFDRMDIFLRAHEGLDAAFKNWMAHKKLALLRWIEQKAAQQIKEQGIQGFADVLNQLLAALQQPEHGEALAARLAATFPVILVDEFQDTDPVQYAIFKQGFIDNGAATFLVGDPKQAIYGFRGGDIYTYLAAKKTATGLFTLTTNFRAETQLMAATNGLVGKQAQPFLTEGIDYQVINAKPADGRALVWVGQTHAAPLQIQRMPPLPEGEKEGKVAVIEDWAVQVTADEIVRLMSAAQNGTAYLTAGVTEDGADAQKIALVGKDVAILVRTKAEGVLMQTELKKRGLSSIVETGASVLASAEAKSLLMLLMAWTKPHDMAQLRLALADELQGWTAANLFALENDEAAILALLNRQQHYADLWQQLGLMAAWRLFYQENKIAERLLALPNGERALTNYTHLLELLQQASTEVHGMVPLVAWLAREINAPNTDHSQAYELRLESDENLIKISTIHKSKGLQFPIVFCPFLWRESKSLAKKQLLDYHNSAGQVEVVSNTQFKENPQLKQKIELEKLTEELRLLYVAVTRSEFRLYMAWPCTEKLHQSALAYWLHGQSAAVQSVLDLDAPKKIGKDPICLSNAEIDADLNAWISTQQGLIDVRVSELMAKPLLYQAQTSADSELTLALAINQRHLAASTWLVSSFSSLKTRFITDTLPEEANEWRDLGAESGDYQEMSAPVEMIEQATEEAIFPRGTVAGKCLHRMLELLDFTQDTAAWDVVILDQLQLFGFEAHHLDSAKPLLQKTLQAPLTNTGKTLAQMTCGQRLDELSFIFPIQNLNLSRFKSVLSHPDYGLHPVCRKAAQQLQSTHLTGYLKGYIDLVLVSEGKLYLIDYKSNLLENYDQAHLAEAMAQAHYYLQYLLYSIALKRYVQARGHDFEAVFGGVRYLFLRGLDENGLGIWHDKPSTALLLALEACF
ncbi:MAG: exodeoxyribonuclease V subunit beta, partial [Neisseriaceae bacterium]|nr:exodeoxyribonuclease V subunit beta [Neisseriaceae bacterium]